MSRGASRALVAACALLYGALLVFLRGAPSVDGDTGIFLSVAARLLDGDRLYAEVFDNKDPLFFYSYAASLWAGGWKAPMALDALWFAVAAGSMAGLLRRIGLAPWLAAVGFVAYPLLLSGAWYYAGFSMLAALALTSLAAWLWADERWLLAGGVVGVALGFRVGIGLVVVAAPIALTLLRPEVARRALPRAVAGGAAVLGTVALVLALRGELGPYISTLRENVAYANDANAYEGRQSGVAGHLGVVVDETERTPLVLALFVAALLVAAWMLWRARRSGSDESPEAELAAAFLATSAATFVTLALTAVWDHHLQTLAIPGALLVVLVASLVARASRSQRQRWVAVTAAVGGALWVLGAFGSSPATGSTASWWRDERSVTADALSSVAGSRFPGEQAVTYARLGRDDEDAHAVFLDDRLELVCPRFHQHLHTADLDAVVRCVAEQRPALVLAAGGFAPDAAAPARWNAFVAGGRAVLERDYEPVLRRASSNGPVVIWARR